MRNEEIEKFLEEAEELPVLFFYLRQTCECIGHFLKSAEDRKKMQRVRYLLSIIEKKFDNFKETSTKFALKTLTDERCQEYEDCEE